MLGVGYEADSEPVSTPTQAWLLSCIRRDVDLELSGGAQLNDSQLSQTETTKTPHKRQPQRSERRNLDAHDFPGLLDKCVLGIFNAEAKRIKRGT